MKTILKYYLPIIPMEQITKVSMLKGSVILSIGVQFNNPTVWASCETMETDELEERLFQLVQTGDGVIQYKTSKFIGTFILNEGHYILHLFEIIDK